MFSTFWLQCVCNWPCAGLEDEKLGFSRWSLSMKVAISITKPSVAILLLSWAMHFWIRLFESHEPASSTACNMRGHQCCILWGENNRNCRESELDLTAWRDRSISKIIPRGLQVDQAVLHHWGWYRMENEGPKESKTWILHIVYQGITKGAESRSWLEGGQEVAFGRIFMWVLLDVLGTLSNLKAVRSTGSFCRIGMEALHGYPLHPELPSRVQLWDTNMTPK